MPARTCPQPAVLIADVEASVADYWSRVQLSTLRIADIREQVMAELKRRQEGNRSELERQEARKKHLHDQQLKLMEARYADAIPLDVLKSEQERITRELAGAQQAIDRCSTQIEAVVQVVEEALLLCVNAHRLYLSAPPAVRRQLNQAVFTRFWIIDDQVHGADLTETFAHLLTPELANRLAEKQGGEDDTKGGNQRGRTARKRAPGARNATLELVRPKDVVQRPRGPLPAETTNPGPNRDRGSNVLTLVELRGFEPLTPALPVRCATSCATAPSASAVLRGARRHRTRAGFSGRRGRSRASRHRRCLPLGR